MYHKRKISRDSPRESKPVVFFSGDNSALAMTKLDNVRRTRLPKYVIISKVEFCYYLFSDTATPRASRITCPTSDYNTPTSVQNVWLRMRMARMEVGCNLKQFGHPFQVLLVNFKQVAKTDYTLFFQGKQTIISICLVFSSRCKSNLMLQTCFFVKY